MGSNRMPRRNDLHRILIIGSGPIVIGQACEFDYSGTQAAKALKADGYDVLLFKDAMRKIGLETPQSQLVNSVKAGLEFGERIGYPNILRPSFTLGGTGGGIAYNSEELAEILDRGIALSPVHEVLIEESALG